MQNTKDLFLGALFFGMGAVTAINEIGIGFYPPSGQFPDGVTRGFRPSDVRSCMGARALATIGDRSALPVEPDNTRITVRTPCT